MAAGVTDRPWEIADIVNLQDGAKKSAKAAKLENSYKTFGAACKALSPRQFDNLMHLLYAEKVRELCLLLPCYHVW